MASQGSTFTPLRFVTQQLAAGPSQLNPRATAFLAASLSESKVCFLAAESDQEAHRVSEGPVLVHKIKTQITALLQSRNTDAQYTSIILIKSIIEVGGWTILHGAGLWIKGLIGICGKPNPTINKILSVFTLTRIFILTNGYPSLVKDLTTPVLASFLTTCLNLAKVGQKCDRSDILAVVIFAFNELVSHHPASFRPFCAQIRALILPLMCPTPSDPTLSDEHILVSEFVSESARRLFVSLCVCAPKNGSSAEWEKIILDIILCLHGTANVVFRALIEDHRPFSHRHYLDEALDLEQVIHEVETRDPGFPAWTGISAGIERLESLFDMLGAFLASNTSDTIKLPVGELVQSIERIFSVLPPTKDNPAQIRPEISKDEREGLFVGLPNLHISATHLCHLLIARLGRDAAAVSMTVLDQILWILENGTPTAKLRQAAYELISQSVRLFGPTVPLSKSPGLSTCFKLCCDDLLPKAISKYYESVPPGSTKQNGSTSSGSINTKPYLGLTKVQSTISNVSEETRLAAAALLFSALTNLPKGFIPSQVRQQIDRTAILCNDKDLMFASAMNPPIHSTKHSSTSSILPFLARAFPFYLGTEAIIRPRMPPIQLERSADGYDFETNNSLDQNAHNEDLHMSSDTPMRRQDDGQIFSEPSPSEPAKHPFTNTTTTVNEDTQNPADDSTSPNPPKRLKVSHDPPNPSMSVSPAPPPNPTSPLQISFHPPVQGKEISQAPVNSTSTDQAEVSRPEQPSLSYPSVEPPMGMEEVKQEGEREGDESESDIPSVEMSSLEDDDDDDDDDDDEKDENGDGKGEMQYPREKVSIL